MFMYGIDYQDCMSTGDSPRILSEIKVYEIANKYFVRDLKQTAKLKFQDAVNGAFENNMAVDAIPLAIKDLYHSRNAQSRELRDILLMAVRKNIEFALQDEEFVNVLKEVADFGVEVIQGLAEDISRYKCTRYKCPNCGYVWSGDIHDIPSDSRGGSSRCCPTCTLRITDWENHQLKDF